MLETHPADIALDKGQLATAIDALTACSQACTACADACLSEPAEMLPHLARCIRADLDCADVCDTTARLLSRHTGYDAELTQAQVQAALRAAESCAGSGGEHAEVHEHCRVCARACDEVVKALTALL